VISDLQTSTSTNSTNPELACQQAGVTRPAAPREGRALRARVSSIVSGAVGLPLNWRDGWRAWSIRLRGPSSHRALYVALVAGIGVFVSFRALDATLASFLYPINSYDEGIVLTGANELLWGKVPYRDFYSNYPPGVFLLIAAAFKLVGTSVAVERALGVAFHLSTAYAAGRVSGRLLGGRFSWITAALVLTWLAPLGSSTCAWLGGLSVALIACERWACAWQSRRPLDYWIAGATLGAVSWLRHELFVYFALILSGIAALWIGVSIKHGERAPLLAAKWTATGALSALCLMWLPLFALVGIEQPLVDLVFDQARYAMPARALPLPPLFQLGRVSWAPFALPTFVYQPFEGAVVLSLFGPALAMAAFALPRRAGLKDRSDVVWTGALALAVLPQLLGRTDPPHAIYTVTPALILSWLWFHRGTARAWRPKHGMQMLFGVLTLFLPTPELPLRAALALPPLDLRRAGGTPVSAGRKQVLAFIGEHTRQGDPIYVGYMDHRWIYVNDMDLYFLANRVGATRYMQFDPNIVNREDTQRQMIQELEATRPRVAILKVGIQRSGEPNDSSNMGSAILDEYLRANYRDVEVVDGHVLALRRSRPQ